jgi:hypothetical protein
MQHLPAGEHQRDPKPRAAFLQNPARLADGGGEAVDRVRPEGRELRGHHIGGLEDADLRHPARGATIGTCVHRRDRVEQGDAMADLQAAAPAGAQLDQNLERGPGPGVVVHPEGLAGAARARARAPSLAPMATGEERFAGRAQLGLADRRHGREHRRGIALEQQARGGHPGLAQARLVEAGARRGVKQPGEPPAGQRPQRVGSEPGRAHDRRGVGPEPEGDGAAHQLLDGTWASTVRAGARRRSP